ncbi:MULTISPECIES: glycine--tRNA ligase subunit beta [unclassified Acidocella]|uniref:glycine--tRNA ligase subunit beta n=1 Tax=unclassified Acidocella TaxID=2648610 RepID=UPI00028DB07B|nr:MULTISPECIES: glycine--tRNA ligase subunit beta [unclassified Acidocella]EKM98913.1 glycyl-tRNA ligase subunit beta [Acidocella sp. MX-AZ02]WBO58662.1 glycine--tRNA ligase subunit beta [Acidocella sp. MX-AZ03]
MAEFFLELFSEEIPARMQKAASEALEAICAQALKPLSITVRQAYYGPRRIALAAEIATEVAASSVSERGPRASAPEQALAGFLRKHGAVKEDLVQEGEFWVLNKQSPAQPAADYIAGVLPELLAKLPWPKSMRWGSGGEFTWVRPLRRVICLLDGAVVPFKLGPVESGNLTEGHRVHGPGPFEVSSAAVWEEKLREHHVIANPAERRARVAEGIAEVAATLGLSVAPDEGLLDEVTGLAEWPVPLIGQIDKEFMELPPEVRELSMKINQKYFALRDETGAPAPYFAFVANLAADDEGKAIIAGNERVLRARLSDARHFWALDLKTPLDSLLPKLEKITFHAKIGTQRQRADRIADLAEEIAKLLQANSEKANWARLAGLWCKADLVTGMVGEFPELQGIMGGYYVVRQHPAQETAAAIGQAISTHYQPKGPSDAVPTGIVAVSVALADKLDTLREFFAVGEKPTGSGDPFALRRAALGVIRIVLENKLRLKLLPLLGTARGELFSFIIERLRVKLRGEGKRFDVLDAVLAAGEDDDLVRLMKRVEALSIMLDSEDGKNLVAAYKRAANILRIENAKDGPHDGAPEAKLFQQQDETNLLDALVIETLAASIAQEEYETAMTKLAAIRPAIDAFFENVTVNAESPDLRRNRLRLLARFTGAVNQVADFSRIEG